MNWRRESKNSNQESKYDGIENLEERILDIRRRIAELRSRLDYTPTQPRTIETTREVQKLQPSVDEAREKKNAELEDIKAKLLGRKK